MLWILCTFFNVFWSAPASGCGFGLRFLCFRVRLGPGWWIWFTFFDVFGSAPDPGDRFCMFFLVFERFRVRPGFGFCLRFVTFSGPPRPRLLRPRVDRTTVSKSEHKSFCMLLGYVIVCCDRCAISRLIFDVRCDCFVPTRVCHDSGVAIGDVDGYYAPILRDITHCAILAVERGHRCTGG